MANIVFRTPWPIPPKGEPAFDLTILEIRNSKGIVWPKRSLLQKLRNKVRLLEGEQ